MRNADLAYAAIATASNGEVRAALAGPPKPDDTTSVRDASFGVAISLLKAGHRVCRAGWNGKGMWLVLVATPVTPRKGTQPYYDLLSTDRYVVSSRTHELLPWIGMKTADNKFVPWLASQTDMLAEDWQTIVV